MGDGPQRDRRRDGWLQKRGITVIHIPVSELPRDIDVAADAIVRMATELAVRPAPPPPPFGRSPSPAIAGAEGVAPPKPD
jgi:hypothetical protein